MNRGYGEASVLVADRMRKAMPEGTRVVLISMEDPYSNLESGSKGIVKFIDDMGTVFVDWDCGSSLGLVHGVDRYAILKEES